MKQIIRSTVLAMMLISIPCVTSALAPIVDDPATLETAKIINDSFIVMLKKGVSVKSHVSSFVQDLVQLHGSDNSFQLVHQYDIKDFYQGYSVQIKDETILTKIRENQDVEYVEYDKVCKIAGSQQRAPWNLARLSSRRLPTSGTYRYDNSAGRNVDIYIVDTGVYTSHREFQGRASFGASFNGQSGKGDPNGHGTHCAGIAAGQKFGVAKKANIIDVRVLRKDGYGRWSDMIAGLSWISRNQQRRKKASVVNISINGGKSPAVNAAVKALYNRGIHVVVAAGNDNTDACRSSPASESSATTVGSINYRDEMSGFSNYGKCLDILAPGDPVESAYPGGTSKSAWMAGTSQAAPHVAGMKALLLSAKKGYSVYGLGERLKSIGSKNIVKKLKSRTPNLVLYGDDRTSLQDENGDDNGNNDEDTGDNDEDNDGGDTDPLPGDEEDDGEDGHGKLDEIMIPISTEIAMNGKLVIQQ